MTAPLTDLETPELKRRLDALARKRNYAADQLGKPLLALAYQRQIDKLLSKAAMTATKD